MALPSASRIDLADIVDVDYEDEEKVSWRDERASVCLVPDGSCSIQCTSSSWAATTNCEG